MSELRRLEQSAPAFVVRVLTLLCCCEGRECILFGALQCRSIFWNGHLAGVKRAVEFTWLQAEQHTHSGISRR